MHGGKNIKIRLAGITDLSTVDWPEKLAAVVHLQSCNLRCPWCQNLNTVDMKDGRVIDTEDVIQHIRRLTPVVNAVVLSGGEPLLQPNACLELLKAARSARLACAIETNGTIPEALEHLLPYLDFVAIDVKAPLENPELYNRTTGRVGVSTKNVKKSLCLTLTSGVAIEVRTTIVSGLNDDNLTVFQIARDVWELSSAARNVPTLRLQQFRNQRTLDPSFQSICPPSRKRLLELARVAYTNAAKESQVKIFTSEHGLENVSRLSARKKSHGGD